MIASYGGNYQEELVRVDLRRLINQIWKLLPMKENNEDWQKQLDTVLNELYGLHELFGDQLNFLILISKLEGLRRTDNFLSYRVVVFGAISLLTELMNGLK